ncbi:MAG TPA: CHAT domain-containing tetratricopeptide repeat protein [Verrucomicrobiae bacterium]|nr:CHAT domain-containing tetratricopeptide repeat protein [Verrucomicrobiae bacterium]
MRELMQHGQYKQALPLAVKALNLSIDKFGPEDKVTADWMTDLGTICQRLGDYTNAEALFSRGLEIRENVLGARHALTARSFRSLGSLYVELGEYAKAEPLLQDALTINKRAFGPESIAAAGCRGELGILYVHMGDYPKAETFDQQALATYREVRGPEDHDTVTAMNNLAALYIDMGEYAKAEPLLQKSLAIREKMLELDLFDTGNMLHTLGVLYFSMGDYAKSESFYQRALSIKEKKNGPEHPDTAITLVSLGNLYMNMGDDSRALLLYLRALKIQEKAFGPEHPVLANTLSRLGAIYSKTDNYLKAESTAQRVLDLDEKTLGPNHPNTAIALLNLGLLYEQMGDLSKAQSFDQRALAIQEKVLGPESPSLSASYGSLAAVYYEMGQYTNAEPLFLHAISIDEKVLAPENPARALHLGNLANLYFDLGRTNEALEFAEKSEQSRLGMLNDILSFASEQERLNYEAENDPYAMFASLNDAPQVALAILRHKGVVLDSLLEDQIVAKASQDPEDHALIEQLGPAKQRLTQLLMTVPEDLKPGTTKERIETRDKLLRQVEQLEGALAKKAAGLGHARRALNVTVEEVQKAIPPRTTLIEFIRYQHWLGHHQWEYRYGAGILAPTGHPKWVCLGPATVIEKDARLCQQLVRDKETKDEVLLSSALRKLYKDVWQPVQTLIPADGKNIVISPDANLNFVSFATILTPDNKFLAEKYSIRYVSSARDLLRKPVKSSGQVMVIFAAPDYVAGGKIDWPPTGVQLLPLPYFAKNAAALAAEVKPWNWPVRIYSGAEASETKLRTISSPRILHFSTHGFFLPETMGGPAHFSFLSWLTGAKGSKQQVTLKNPMYRSGIALAGAQVTLDAWKRGETPPTDSDGILTAEEAGSLDLQGTWLVVLAACDTGIGESISGEGIMGLRRGFVQAGAQNLLMTLWPVFDVPSGELMLDFYSTLHRNNDPSEALAKVQRDWLVKLRSKFGLLPAVVMAGAFIVNSQGPPT